MGSKTIPRRINAMKNPDVIGIFFRFIPRYRQELSVWLFGKEGIRR